MATGPHIPYTTSDATDPVGPSSMNHDVMLAAAYLE